MAKLQGNPAAEAARQKERQAELAKATDRLAGDLQGAALGQSPGSPLDKAADAAGQAKERSAQAARDAGTGRTTDARRQAGDRLDEAAAAAEAAARATPAPPTPVNGPAKAAGDAIRDAKGQMRQAQDQLRKPGDGKGAAGAMNQAAEALNQAARSAGPAGAEPGQPVGEQSGGNDGSGQAPTTDKLPADVAKYLDRPWGELPGDVKNRIIQEIAARYGEDYARTIKLYFEQIATKK
jgi:hypothetical protein